MHANPTSQSPPKTLVALIPLLLLLASPAAAQDVEPALAAVVRISGTRHETPVRGSGFVVALDADTATIVTASHVVQGTRFEVVFSTSDESFSDVRVLDMEVDNPNGLAVLKLRGRIPDDVGVLEIDAATSPRAGESLFLVGFPQRSPVALVKSRTFSARRGNRLLIDLPVGEGFSGGPVLRDGKVVGLVTSEDGQLTYAVRGLVVASFVEGLNVLPGSRRSPPTETAPPPLKPKPCRTGDERTFDGIEFVRICGGGFMMGSNDGDGDEKPPHKVTLTEFWIGKYEVTNVQYRRFNKSHAGDDKLPAVNVTWTKADTFCNTLGFQLPTEAQWESAARAGTAGPWSFGADESALSRYAWYRENSEDNSQPVGTRESNVWGLYDMHGNVWEWVADWYGSYSGGAEADPQGPSEGVSRVLRGGSFAVTPRYLRSANRYGIRPEYGIRFIGFRCVRGLLRQP
jgi:sulfatase modifying factor 1